MRVTDVVLSFPALIVIITIVALIGPSLQTIILGIGLFQWPVACRIVRGMALSIREQDFVVAARALGARERRIILRHLVPSVLAPLTVTATFAVAQAILTEAALSFLGLGVRPPEPSWGNMLNEAQSLTILESMPWLWLPPGVAIAVTVLAINFVGDGMRDALDPRQRI
jgi:peptide/nickel transport system permease protein